MLGIDIISNKHNASRDGHPNSILMEERLASKQRRNKYKYLRHGNPKIRNVHTISMYKMNIIEKIKICRKTI